MGLVHMVLWAWGNDRFEFDPGSQEGLDQPSVDALNAKYGIIGWRVFLAAGTQPALPP